MAASDRLAARYSTAKAAEYTYPEVGATRRLAERAGYPPGGYHFHRERLRVGHGVQVFASARAAVFNWEMQRRASARVYPSDQPVAEGHTVLVALGLGPLLAVAPCRVCWVVDEPNQAGFGYGTLPGHPVSGEEAFVVERDAAGDVWAMVLAFSRPATWYTRLAGPVGRLGQRWMTRRYLNALKRN